MFIFLESIGKSFVSIILKELEQWAKELKYSRTVLETEKKQIDAVAIYKNVIITSYQITGNM